MERTASPLPAQHDAVILIPAFEPDERLLKLVASLREAGFSHIIVVDDGSSAHCATLFQRHEPEDSPYRRRRREAQQIAEKQGCLFS